MPANRLVEQTDLVDYAVERLRAMLPGTWAVERSNRAGPVTEAAETNGAIDIRDPRGTYATVAVEAKRSFDPRAVGQLTAGLGPVIRSIAGNIPLLVVAPWISARTRELLSKEGINFLDLTGNVLIKLENPALFIRSAGATKNPQPAARGQARFRGPKAARLIRLLVDVRPPYGVGELAAATGLAQGYVSRLLDTLDREALVERSRRGRVEDADPAGLLQRWAEYYDVLKSNTASLFLAPNGARQTLAQLAQRSDLPPVAITGSFAAQRLAPVAAPALLLAYSDDADAVASSLRLLPADEGANIALLRAFDPVAWERSREEQGLRYVAPSQAAVDCLTGTGRMPAEGEAVLAWMSDHETRWRLPTLAELNRADAA